MCGIAGEVRWSGGAAPDAVSRMVAGIAHRGPDDRGAWISPDGACSLGHARLAIIDLSPAGHQPMRDPNTGNAIVFNGEIYNFQALRRECERLGDVFVSTTDTEVILALYRRYGVACLQRLRGMFAFAIWEPARRRLFVARDRVGKKPLVYAWTPRGFAFCSEIHPLACHRGVDTTTDEDALEFYFQCDYIPAPWTIYRGIRKLPPAHYALIDAEGMKIEPYWDVDYRRKVEIADEDVLDAFEEKLTEAVRLRMIADVPLGALLSGGVDSSVVVALMARSSASPVRTFSIGYAHETINELPFAEEAARRCGTLHHPEVLHGDVGSLLPELARHYGEPFGDSSAVPSFFVSAAARRHVTVALNGDGGDELLGGYWRYSLSPLALRTASLLQGSLRPSTLSRLAPRLAVPDTLPQRLARKLVMRYTHPEVASLNMYASAWNDAARRELLEGGRPHVLPAWREHWLTQAFEHADNAIDRMLWLDNRTYLPGDLLVKMDIASMHCGLETRSPLLDHEVIEFCASLPMHHKVRGRVGKFLLKQLAERYFPREFVHRRKRGFSMPMADWLRGPLRALLHDVLHDAHAMAPLSRRAVARTLREFESGDVAQRSRVWSLLMYGSWRRNCAVVSHPAAGNEAPRQVASAPT